MIIILRQKLLPNVLKFSFVFEHFFFFFSFCPFLPFNISWSYRHFLTLHGCCLTLSLFPRCRRCCYFLLFPFFLFSTAPQEKKEYVSIKGRTHTLSHTNRRSCHFIIFSYQSVVVASSLGASLAQNIFARGKKTFSSSFFLL